MPVVRARQSSEAPERDAHAQVHRCDACGAEFVGKPAGAGLFVWTRGEEIRYEEPPLCSACASTVALGAMAALAEGDEE